MIRSCPRPRPSGYTTIAVFSIIWRGTGTVVLSCHSLHTHVRSSHVRPLLPPTGGWPQCRRRRLIRRLPTVRETAPRRLIAPFERTPSSCTAIAHHVCEVCPKLRRLVSNLE